MTNLAEEHQKLREILTQVYSLLLTEFTASPDSGNCVELPLKYKGLWEGICEAISTPPLLSGLLDILSTLRPKIEWDILKGGGLFSDADLTAVDVALKLSREEA